MRAGGRPLHDIRSATLRSRGEVTEAAAALAGLGLPRHTHVPEKDWDIRLALEFIRANVPRDGRILDAGGTISPILDHLEALGYRSLWACDLSRSKRQTLRRLIRRSRIRFSIQDLTRTDYPDAAFDAVTCLSVIEHGVDHDAYLREMARILKPGGYVITSTDYWCDPVDTAGIFPFGGRWGEMTVYGPAAIRTLVASGAAHGLILDGPLDLECGEPVVRWHDRDYTFTYLVLRRT